MRVLIADDDAVLRLALKVHLQRWSYEVVECSDGGQAWQELQAENPPPIAIIDWNMPDVSSVNPAGSLVTFYFALRDNRGGFDWITRAACLTP